MFQHVNWGNIQVMRQKKLTKLSYSTFEFIKLLSISASLCATVVMGAEHNFVGHSNIENYEVFHSSCVKSSAHAIIVSWVPSSWNVNETVHKLALLGLFSHPIQKSNCLVMISTNVPL